ncbi:MAG: hypothetical protein Q8J99_13150 [Sulfuritalea sp.]|nr:hypothetical protein [Sulfuritalea sp.]
MGKPGIPGISILLNKQKPAIAHGMAVRPSAMGDGRIDVAGTPADLNNSAAMRRKWLQV